jgi:hypothetical protein
MWEIRLSQEVVNTPITRIDISHIPSWLIPSNSKSSQELEPIQKTKEVMLADQLPKLVIPIVWDKKADFDGKDELDEALENAQKKGMDLPDTDQTIAQDPRLSNTVASFKDSIRRQYNCKDLLINIRSLQLEFLNKSIGDGHISTMNILKKPWGETQSTFQDQANSAFCLRVMFQALDSEDDQIYKSFEPPPAISAFFRTADGDV